MRSKWIVPLAWLISGLAHLAVIFAPSWELPEPPGEATRILAQLQPRAVLAEKPRKPVRKPARARSAPVSAGKPSARLPDKSAPGEALPFAEEAMPSAEESLAQTSAPSASQSVPSDASAPDLPPAVERLARQGRIQYTGTASFVPVTGLVSWEHDGEAYHARMGAGFSGDTSSFNYESRGALVGAQVQAQTTQDDRRGKRTSGLIDHGVGIVRMQRGEDSRERRINGLAVSLSSLPLALACLDEKIEKAALFIVGDFWVEDAVVINRGLESLDLPGKTVEARHFQSRIHNGKNMDIWLAPAWRNAPVRIRYDDGGLVVELKAVEVEVEGEILHKHVYRSNVSPPSP